MSKRFAFASFLVASVAALFLAFGPSIQQEHESTDAGGSTIVTSSSTSLVSSEGAAVLLILAIPVLITLMPVLVSRRGVRTGTAVLLLGLCVLGLASIGLFFVPAAVLMSVAAFVHDPRPAPISTLS
jgi:MFS family permease